MNAHPHRPRPLRVPHRRPAPPAPCRQADAAPLRLPGPTRKRRAAVEGPLRLVADATALLLVVLAGSLTGAGRELQWLGISALGVVAAMAVTHAYRPSPRLSLANELRAALVAPALVALGVWSARLTITGEQLTASPLVTTWLALTGALLLSRAVMRRLLAARALRQRALVIGAGEVGRRVARRLQETPATGLEPIGHLDERRRSAGDLPVLGATWDLERVVAEHGVQAVIVSFSTAPPEALVQVVRRCWAMGVNVLVVPRLFEVEGARAAVHHLGALPLISLAGGEPRGWELRAKHVVDRALAGVLALVLAPLLGALALAVLVTSGRPILYRQRRVGAGGRVFEILKFRTMRDAAGQVNAGWAAAALGGEPLGGVDRRTPVGAFLRRWSLDELPQLFNVLRGDMSLIGPRPEQVPYVERFNAAIDRYAERHRVRTGITGWAQVNGLRGDTSLADRVEWDNHYIENWSFWLDARIALRSLQAVLGRRNAG